MLVEPFETGPVCGERTVLFAVATEDSVVFPTAVRRCPAGANWVDEVGLAGEGSVRAVAAVKGDSFPVDEIARGRRGDAQGVVIVDHPSAAFVDAARTFIQTDRDAFLRD